MAPLQRQVKDQRLWAAHLVSRTRRTGASVSQAGAAQRDHRPPRWALSAFEGQAPDSGNAESWALFTDEKACYLRPLLDGEITSCYSMTEPQGGTDPGRS